MVERALIMSLFVIVWSVSVIVFSFVGVPDSVTELTKTYESFTQTDDLVQSFTNISQVLEGPVN